MLLYLITDPFFRITSKLLICVSISSLRSRKEVDDKIKSFVSFVKATSSQINESD
jgi:hypothetical protein